MVMYFLLAFRRKLRRAISNLRALGLAGLAAAVVLSGTFFFYLAEPTLPDGQPNSLFASLYWVFTTLSTVGYGDIYPSNFWARMVFFYVIIFGLGVFAAAVTEIGTYLSNKRLLQMRGLHGLKLKRHIIIAGYGESTDELIQRLSKHDIGIAVVDENLDPSVMISRGIDMVSGNPVQSETLRKAGIQAADSLVVSALPDEKAVMVALKAKELNPDISVISVCQKHEDYRIMSAAGIDLVVPVSRLQGDLLADAVVDSKGLDFIMHLIGGTDGLVLDQLTADRPTTVGALMKTGRGRAVAVFKGGMFVVDFKDETALEPSEYVVMIRPGDGT